MVRGKIIKGIAGFYYVYVAGSGVYECRARGIFRREQVKPLVGDDAGIDILDEKEHLGNVSEIFPRRNQLIRPPAANVDQALIIFAPEHPRVSFALLDRFLICMEREGIPSLICFNKKDLGEEKELCLLKETYEKAGYPIFLTSAARKEGIGELKEQLIGKTTVAAGPSGVGKSSLTNLMQDSIHMETGEISRKLARGRNTTRHCELIPIDGSSFLMDTPGFSAFDLAGMEKEELKGCFPEFRPYEGKCRFQGCAHVNEPDCAVKAAVAEGILSSVRYEDYTEIYKNLMEMEKRRYS
jgi:ribosome biogenesis GTPase